MRHHIRSVPAVSLMVVAGVCVVLVGAATLVIDPGGAASAIFRAAVVIVGGWMVATALRGGLVARPEGVEVRSFRTRFIPWSDVEAFYVGGNWSIVPWFRLHIRLTSNEVVVAPYVASLGPIGPDLQPIVEELNERVTRA